MGHLSASQYEFSVLKGFQHRNVLFINCQASGHGCSVIVGKFVD